jgi:hypothetical protein
MPPTKTTTTIKMSTSTIPPLLATTRRPRRDDAPRRFLLGEQLHATLRHFCVRIARFNPTRELGTCGAIERRDATRCAPDRFHPRCRTVAALDGMRSKLWVILPNNRRASADCGAFHWYDLHSVLSSSTIAAVDS